MKPSFTVNILEDTTGPLLAGLSKIASHSETRLEMARRCVALTQGHVEGLGENKRGWPTTGFYKAVAKDGVASEQESYGFAITADHPIKPGAMRQRFHGGTINMKDKLLTIPARAEFYGHSPTEFTNLRFVLFASGAKALVIGKGGVGKVDFETGREKNVRGAGARAALMVAYWLKESVTQTGNANGMPKPQEYLDTCTNVLMKAVEDLRGGA